MALKRRELEDLFGERVLTGCGGVSEVCELRHFAVCVESPPSKPFGKFELREKRNFCDCETVERKLLKRQMNSADLTESQKL